MALLPSILSGRIRHVPGLDPGCGHNKDSGFLLSQECPRAFIPSFRFLRQAQDRQGSQRRGIIGLRIKTKTLDSRLQMSGMTEGGEVTLTLPSPTVGRGFFTKEGCRFLLHRRGGIFGRYGSGRVAQFRAPAVTRSGPSRFRGLSYTG